MYLDIFGMELRIAIDQFDDRILVWIRGFTKSIFK